MKNIALFIFTSLASLSVLLNSCETVIDADLPLHKLAITLNSTFHPDTTIQVHLSENKFILDGSYDYKVISGATVQLFAGAKLVGELQQDDSTGMYVLDYYPERGIAYTITAEKAGMDKVEATDMIPVSEAQVEILSVEKRKNHDYDQKYELAYTIDDPAGADYYEIRLYRLSKYYEYYDDGDTSYHYVAGESYNELPYDEVGAELNEFENYRSPYLFSDELFDGQKKEIRIEFYNFSNYNYWEESEAENDTSEWLLIAQKVSESYYRYETSKELQQDVGENIFAEPAPVYNNIVNGFGIFAGYNKKAIEFEIISNEN